MGARPRRRPAAPPGDADPRAAAALRLHGRPGGARSHRRREPRRAHPLARSRPTAGFELTDAQCRGREFCPNGPFVLTFSTPVKGAELLRQLIVRPRWISRFPIPPISASAGWCPRSSSPAPAI